MLEIAERNRLPLISLTESGRRRSAAAGGHLRARRGASFTGSDPAVGGRDSDDLRWCSDRSTAGGAYMPGMSDYTVLVQNQAAGLPRGPAAGEDGDRRGHRRRGAWAGPTMHARVSGLADYLAARRARRDPHRPRDRRRTCRCGARPVQGPTQVQSTSPCYDPEDLLALGADGPAACRWRCGRSSARYWTARGCRSSNRSTAPRWSAARGFDPRLPGRGAGQQRHPVLRGGQQGCALHPAGERCAMCRCCSCRTSPASWSARRYERGGIIKDGSKLINAVSNSTVPHVTLDGRRVLRRR